MAERERPDRQRIVVVCPGRGTYNAPELGYLARHHAGHPLLARFDALRAEAGKPTLTELDGAAKFTPAHLRGDNAAPLIHACAWLDFLSLDRQRFEVVAVTGNSMGWYTALACAGAVSPEHGFAIADALGVHSQKHGEGTQSVLVLADAEWRVDPALASAIEAAMARHGVLPSIRLGGMLVVAGSPAVLDAFEADLPPLPRAPMRLAGHGPFHTPLMAQSAQSARAALPEAWFTPPQVPLIDGRGAIWRTGSTRPHDLWDYTFGHQILAPYDFTAAITVALREFAPDLVVLTGPGETLGGAIAQVLIHNKWLDISSRTAFSERQGEDPFLIGMGRPGQRGIVIPCETTD
ncbi:ACP S-malonyltransferase [Novosphingobium sp. KCTC 2891]|uniref:ACP S-malonyltransferase n=1 Tax=Novosphingobium sp. KCTC 2891 TaxID=2989730 RepID=UPI002222E1EA|nr:ACP S-malonyltransferase [Novosphingobium sp. KCTC 2891]MCW1384737.1 ACP S-malonyltransferase [Novosphingobium sp. KCTC 2891]